MRSAPGRRSDLSRKLGTTFGRAAVCRGDLTPECAAAAMTAVLEALGKKRGPEDNRTQEQRFHDGLQEACALLWASGWSSWDAGMPGPVSRLGGDGNLRACWRH